MARYAQIRAGRTRPKQVTQGSFVGVSRMLIAIAEGGQSRTSQAIMLKQVLNTMYALWEMQKAAGQAQAAALTERTVRGRLALVADRLNGARPAAPAGAGAGQGVQPSVPGLGSPLPNPLVARPRTTSAARPREGGVER